MKRVTILTIVLGLTLVSLAACGGDSDDEGEHENAAAAETTLCPVLR